MSLSCRARRLLTVTYLTAVTTALVGCRGCGHEGPGPTAPAVARPLASMLSIHAHARYPDGRFPRGLEPAPLKDAAKFLADAKVTDDPLAPSRRRRAVAKLAAYGLRPGVSAQARVSIEEAIRILVRDDRKAAAIIALAYQYHKRSEQEGTPRGEVENSDPPAQPGWIETEISDTYATEVESVSCWKKLQVSVPDGGRHPSAWAKVQVDHSLGDVERAIDPQNWDVCSPFFIKEKTYLAKPTGGSYPASNCEVAEGPALPSGMAYGYPIPVVLFETFVCQVTQGCDAWFTNLLDVTTNYAYTGSIPTEFAVSYNFRDGVCGKVAGVDEKILTDDGWMHAVSKGPNQTEVEGSKIIGFESDVANGILRGIFEVQFDELAGEVGELACCSVP